MKALLAAWHDGVPDSKLAKLLEEKWGVSAAAPVASGVRPPTTLGVLRNPYSPFPGSIRSGEYARSASISSGLLT